MTPPSNFPVIAAGREIDKLLSSKLTLVCKSTRRIQEKNMLLTPPPIGGSHSPASELGGLEENGVGGARHTIKTGSATQRIMNPGALMTSRRCCAGHLQTDVTLCEGQAPRASREGGGMARRAHKTEGAELTLVFMNLTLFLLLQFQQLPFPLCLQHS